MKNTHLHLCQTGPTINKLEIGNVIEDKLSTQNLLYLEAEAFTNLHNLIQNANKCILDISSEQ